MARARTLVGKAEQNDYLQKPSVGPHLIHSSKEREQIHFVIILDSHLNGSIEGSRRKDLLTRNQDLI